MKGRKLILVVSLVMALMMSLSGTIAYLTDTDSDVNVMTLGDVKIDQLENGKSEGGFETQPLYPAYVNGTEVTGKLDKAVTVKNTGKSEAYVRTWIALEAGDLSVDDFAKVIHADIDDANYTLSIPQIVEIEGVKYYVVCATYNDKLAAGETTKKASLKSVYMDPEADNAEVAMFGNTYEILVFTQAVQTANMETIGAAAALSAGFGDAHPWVGGVDILPTKTVKTADDLRAALVEGGATVILANDVELDADKTIMIAKGKNVRLDLAGHTLSGVSNETGANRNMIDVNGGTLTVNNGKLEFEHTGTNMGWGNSTNIFNITAGGVLNLNGVTAVNNGGSDMAFVAHLNNWGEVTLNVTNSTLKSTYVAVRVFNSGYDMNNVSIHNSTIWGNSNAFWVHNYTAEDFGSAEKAAKQKELLNFDIKNGSNLFVGDIRYGFTNSTKDYSDVVAVDTADEITAALSNGKNVVLADDVQMTAATTAPYGNKYAVKLDGGIIDGDGNELEMECYGDDYGIMTTGGTIKNLTIKEGCRAIMIMYPTEDIIIDNVNIGGDGVLYPINTGEAGVAGIKLTVTNSTLKGWTSFGNIESASFTNVKFEQGTYYNNIYGRVFKPYVNTTLENCSFIEHFNIDLSALTNGHKVTVKNCTVNGQKLTADLIKVPVSNADYDTELITADLPSWATSVADCMIFE